MVILSKISAPGWDKEFDTIEEAEEELDGWICNSCYVEFWDEYGEFPQDIFDLLWTACGCEFGLFDENDDPIRGE